MRLALAVLAACFCAVAGAQGFPSRPVTLIVPFAPGGSADVAARQMAERVASYLGQNVIVENRVGAGGTIGTGSVARAAPDGYTVLLGTTSALGVAPALYRSVPYDPIRSFVPVIEVTHGPFVLAVRPDVPAGTLGELVALAKRRPGKLNAGSAGKGSVHHLALELFKQAAGVDIVHVPFTGGGPAWQALVGGSIDLLFDGMPGPLLYSGRARPLAVAGPSRIPGLPGVPTFAEAGVPGVEAVFFWAMLAPAGTPPEVVATLHAAFARALRDPALKADFARISMETTPGTQEEAAALLAREVPRWRNLVRKAGLKPE